MLIGTVQFAPRYGQPEANRAHVATLVAGVSADVLVLPELFTSGYFFQSTADARAVAEPVPDGPSCAWLTGQARTTGTTFVAGLPERAPEGALFNSAVIVPPDGPVTCYRKIHLYNEEKLHFAPGQHPPPVVDLTARDGTPYRLGLMICFDWFYPEVARSLALRGADIIAHPSNLVRKNCPRAMPIRALENRVFAVTANRYGSESNGDTSLTFIGQSQACAPNGELLYRAPRAGDAVNVEEIDPAKARSKRVTAHNDLWEDRAPATYTP
jgi:predicted amidohydrolase